MDSAILFFHRGRLRVGTGWPVSHHTPCEHDIMKSSDAIINASGRPSDSHLRQSDSGWDDPTQTVLCVCQHPTDAALFASYDPRGLISIWRRPGARKNKESTALTHNPDLV